MYIYIHPIYIGLLFFSREILYEIMKSVQTINGTTQFGRDDVINIKTQFSPGN